MAQLKIGEQIALLRRQKNMTQEELAQALGVTNQAVSKWESAQCCPDIGLLPDIAKLFCVSMDALFGEEAKASEGYSGAFSWKDDDTLRILVCRGRKILSEQDDLPRLRVKLDGDVQKLICYCDVECQSVQNGVSAEGDVACDGNINGDVSAEGDVVCKGNINGGVKCGGDLSCEGSVSDGVSAEGDVVCKDNSNGEARARVGGTGENAAEQAEDGLLSRAIALSEQASKVSTSLLQRKLSIGYAKASYLVGRMAELGYIETDGSSFHRWKGKNASE